MDSIGLVSVRRNIDIGRRRRGATPTASQKEHRTGGLRRAKSSASDKDPAAAQAVAAASLKQNLEHIRLAQVSAELKRFQLLKKLDSLKTRRNFELGESVLASLYGIRTYFGHCSDLVQGLTPQAWPASGSADCVEGEV